MTFQLCSFLLPEVGKVFQFPVALKAFAGKYSLKFLAEENPAQRVKRILLLNILHDILHFYDVRDHFLLLMFSIQDFLLPVNKGVIEQMDIRV